MKLFLVRSYKSRLTSCASKSTCEIRYINFGASGVYVHFLPLNSYSAVLVCITVRSAALESAKKRATKSQKESLNNCCANCSEGVAVCGGRDLLPEFSAPLRASFCCLNKQTNKLQNVSYGERNANVSLGGFILVLSG